MLRYCSSKEKFEFRGSFSTEETFISNVASVEMYVTGKVQSPINIALCLSKVPRISWGVRKFLDRGNFHIECCLCRDVSHNHLVIQYHFFYYNFFLLIKILYFNSWTIFSIWIPFSLMIKQITSFENKRSYYTIVGHNFKIFPYLLKFLIQNH